MKKYIEENGHAKIPKNCIYENIKLGTWVQTQRSNKKSDTLALEKQQLLESLPQWSWKVFEEQWNTGFEYLNQYVEENSHAKVPLTYKYKGFNLGSWVSHRRREKIRNKISPERIEQLESLLGWVWFVKQEK